MRRKIILLWFMLICFVGSVSAQQVDRQQKRRFVVVPADQVLVTVAQQPECPLKFEEAKMLADMNGSKVSAHAMRNEGTKPIRSFTVTILGGTMTESEEFTKKLLMPGEKTSGEDIEIVPLTKELRDKLKLNGPMRFIMVFMVIRVEYADGSIYSAEPAYKAFQKFSDELDDIKANAKAQ